MSYHIELSFCCGVCGYYFPLKELYVLTPDSTFSDELKTLCEHCYRAEVPGTSPSEV